MTGGTARSYLQMIDPQITYRGMQSSPALDARIREQVARLEEFHPNITSCHVIVVEADRHKSKGNHFEVHVDLHVPHREIVATLQEHEDPYVALSQAFDVVVRQLEEDIERKRGQVKRHGDDRTHL